MINDTDEFRKTRKAIEKGQTPSRYVATCSLVARNMVVYLLRNKMEARDSRPQLSTRRMYGPDHIPGEHAMRILKLAFLSQKTAVVKSSSRSRSILTLGLI